MLHSDPDTFDMQPCVLAPLQRGRAAIGAIAEGSISTASKPAEDSSSGICKSVSNIVFHSAYATQHDMQHSTAQCDTAQHSTAQHNTARHSTAWHVHFVIVQLSSNLDSCTSVHNCISAGGHDILFLTCCPPQNAWSRTRLACSLCTSSFAWSYLQQGCLGKPPISE